MEKITNININQQEKNQENINKENISPNKENENKNKKINPKLDNQRQNNFKFNLNSKYDSVLLEELNNSKTKSWRIDITNATHEEENIIKFNSKKINLNEIKIESEEQKENDEINKDDRFKDFDEILIIEENKDKKRKNKSVEKLMNAEKSEKIPKPTEKRKNINTNKHFIQENNNINKNSSTLSELNKCFENNDKNDELEDKKNDIINSDENNKNSAIIFNNNEKLSNLKEVINNNSNNSKEINYNKHKSINLEYNEDKKSYMEKEEKKYIKNIVDDLKNEKITIDYLYNNYMDIKDKNKDIKKDSNDLNKKLLEKTNTKKKNCINNKKTNPNSQISKSCNIKNNQLTKKSNNENKFIYPSRSQNLKRNLIYGKNTINIQLSIKRTTRSAKDIKKHMSYYLMDEIIKSPKNEIKNIQNIMNKSPSKRNYYSNNISLNSFLSLQIGYDNINPKNQIKYMKTPLNIFKNSFSDKIKKKINYINANKKCKLHRNKNNYIDIEFLEECKQDNFYGKASKEFYTTKNKLFEKQNKNANKVNNYNFYKSQNDFYHEKNKIENDTFFSNSKNAPKKNNINNYLFKNYTINKSQKNIFSFYADEYKSSDFYKEKNEVFSTNFNCNINPIKKYELKYNTYSNKIFNNNKNIIFPTMKSSESFTSIFPNKINIKNNSNHSYFYCNNYNNRRYRNNLIQRKANAYHTNFYL